MFYPDGLAMWPKALLAVMVLAEVCSLQEANAVYSTIEPERVPDTVDGWHKLLSEALARVRAA